MEEEYDFSDLIPGDYVDDSYGEIDPDQRGTSTEAPLDVYNSNEEVEQDKYQSLSSDYDYSVADSFNQYANENVMFDLRSRSRSDRNVRFPDLVVDNSASNSYGGGRSRKIRFR